ncbi:MAG: tetratricopeptide repeat protein, partial [Planctomycetota bacterium]
PPPSETPVMTTLPRPTTLLLAAALTLTVGCNAFGPSAQQKKVSKHLADARQFQQEGMDDSALAALSLALEENPKLTEAYMGMGNIFLDRGDFDLALERFDRAVENDPNNHKALYRGGLAAQKNDQIDEAITRYLRALAIAPQDFESNREIASAYLQLGEPRTALPYARLATTVNPESQPAWSNLAATYSLLGQYESAIDAYRTANELGELADPVLLGLADAHIRLGNYPRAINTLNSLILSSPSGTAHERLGYALFKLRRFEQALDHYEESLQFDTEDIAALNGAGACYMTLYLEGQRENRFQKERAVECWRRSVMLQPQQPRIIDLLSRYSRL